MNLYFVSCRIFDANGGYLLDKNYYCLSEDIEEIIILFQKKYEKMVKDFGRANCLMYEITEIKLLKESNDDEFVIEELDNYL